MPIGADATIDQCHVMEHARHRPEPEIKHAAAYALAALLPGPDDQLATEQLRSLQSLSKRPNDPITRSIARSLCGDWTRPIV